MCFVKQSTCYAITPDTHQWYRINANEPDTHQWYRINANEITDNHKIALCKDPTVHKVSLPSAKPLEVNTVETIARLTHSQIPKDHPDSTYTQSI